MNEDKCLPQSCTPNFAIPSIKVCAGPNGPTLSLGHEENPLDDAIFAICCALLAAKPASLAWRNVLCKFPLRLIFFPVLPTAAKYQRAQTEASSRTPLLPFPVGSHWL